MAEKNEVDEISGIETTGHEWDGIKELNNPLPRWWLWTLYATIVFAIGYTIAYPAWPGITGATKGVLGWSSRADVAADIAAVEAGRAELATKLVSTELTEVSSDPDLLQFAVAGGSSAYKVYCSQCHGSGAAGGDIYPNLVDDDWIWGGKIDDIHLTLMHGIRHPGDDDTRFNEMPRYGADEILERDQIIDVAWYVRQISNQEFEAEAAARGQTVYADNCAACHGEMGEGIRDLGGPRLNDAIWLYGGSHEEIVAQINNPKQGVMPAWSTRLPEVTVRQLALYVHSLGGGE
ncbi:MAG: cytochrome-c oxidase, cbb3-type subunit III [Pseudomonadota bacterium]